MLKTRNTKVGGFTLVETIVAIFIFTLLALGTSALFTHIFIGSNNRLAAIDSVDQARAITTNFANELRTAATADDSSFPIYRAGDNEIIFFTNYKLTNDTYTRNRYFLEEGKLYKGVILSSGTPPIYDTNSETLSVLLSSLENTTEPIFYYYPGNYSGSSTPLVQPVNINDVKFVRMNLNILKNNERNATSSFNISAGSAIRNVKTDL